MASKPETDLIKATLKYCELSGIVAWRNQSGTVVLTNVDGKRRAIKMSRPGVSDIIGVMPDGTGRLFAAEAKYGKGRVSVNQQGFLDRINCVNGVAFAFWSLDEFIKKIDVASA